MVFKQKINIIIAGIILATPFCLTTSQVQAASFTNKEINEAQQIQQQYAGLPKIPYSQNNIYAVKPHLEAPFSEGKLNGNYISEQLTYINYYRRLFGLVPISSNNTDNDNAQITASVMAAVNANPFVNQHGLPSETQPSFINDMYWTLAKNTSNSSNLNFNVSNQSAGGVITDLLTDSYNLDGSDTGHRAWLLSTRLTTTGIGAAYGSNGYRYSVQQAAYASDNFKAASSPSVSYPSGGIFPIELLQGNNIAWSLYLSDQIVTNTPEISITDLDTGQKAMATNVHNYSSKGYGNFSTILTYFPGNINLVSGHQYSVNVAGVTAFSFKLFNENAANQPAFTSQKSETKPQVNNSEVPIEQKDIDMKSELLLKAEKLRDSLLKDRIVNPTLFGKSYQDGKNFYNLGSNQWFHDIYTVRNPELKAGILDITNTTIDQHIYSSPYVAKQKPAITVATANKSYAYGQIIDIGKTKWYYLGQNKWVRQHYTKKPVQNH